MKHDVWRYITAQQARAYIPEAPSSSVARLHNPQRIPELAFQS